MNTFKRLIPMIILLVFEIVFGVLLIINGEKVTEVIFLIFGILMLAGGVFTLIRTLVVGRNQPGGASGVALAMAVLMIAVGGFFAAASGSVVSVMGAVTLVIGIIMAFTGVVKLAGYITIKKQTPISALAIVGAIVTIILGIVIAFNPFAATEAMWIINGVIIIVSAVFDIISLIVYGKSLSEYEKQLIKK